jgi:hypothetical protein
MESSREMRSQNDAVEDVSMDETKALTAAYRNPQTVLIERGLGYWERSSRSSRHIDNTSEPAARYPLSW